MGPTFSPLPPANMPKQPTPQKASKSRHHFSNFWKSQWKENGERMKANLDEINARRRAKLDERVKQIEVLLPMMPDELLPAGKFRDLLLDNWNATYGEELTKPDAWKLVQFAYRNGIIARFQDKYGSQKLVDQTLMMADPASELGHQE